MNEGPKEEMKDRKEIPYPRFSIPAFNSAFRISPQTLINFFSV